MAQVFFLLMEFADLFSGKGRTTVQKIAPVLVAAVEAAIAAFTLIWRRSYLVSVEQTAKRTPGHVAARIELSMIVISMKQKFIGLKHTASADGTGRLKNASGSLALKYPYLAICVRNTGNAASLERGKAYRVIKPLPTEPPHASA